MNKKILRIIAVILFLTGIVLIADAGITGFVIFKGKQTEPILGILLTIISIFLMSICGLEDQLEVHFERRGKRNALAMRRGAIPEITTVGQIQLNNEDPLDAEDFVNLTQVKEMLPYIGPKGIEEMREKYEEKLIRKVNQKYQNYYRQGKIDKENIIKYYKPALAIEQFIKILDPKYKSRPDRIRELRETLGHEAKFYIAPIKRGSATYVHLSSEEKIDSIYASGIRKGGERTYVQAFVFPNYEKAIEWVSGLRKGQKVAGVVADTALIFTTPEVPKMNQFSGNVKGAGRWKALFEEDVTPEMITFKEKKKILH